MQCLCLVCCCCCGLLAAAHGFAFAFPADALGGMGLRRSLCCVRPSHLFLGWRGGFLHLLNIATSAISTPPPPSPTKRLLSSRFDLAHVGAKHDTWRAFIMVSKGSATASATGHSSKEGRERAIKKGPKDRDRCM
uniref:Putative secreted protein n=1 Tax=Anopheles darlingi TaxID=43151 RepID=A0A2M4D7F5_ANODA